MTWFDDLKTPRIKTPLNQRVSKVPEGLWVKCNKCGEILQNKTLKESHQVCPECSYHFRMNAWERIALLSDAVDETEESVSSKSTGKGSRKKSTRKTASLPGTAFEEHSVGMVSTDPLKFDDIKPYRDRLRESFQKTELGDACIIGKTRLRGVPYHLGVFEFKFMGGSMGVVVGEKLTLLFEHALEDELPAVVVSASGGARMQEGILSLMQMAKTCALVDELRKKGLPFISILTDPTTGGVAASFSMMGDIILAEPEALIGFAGPRVIQQTIRQTLPPGFQRSEFLMQHGFVDRVVPRNRLAHEVSELLLRLGRKTCRFPKGI